MLKELTSNLIPWENCALAAAALPTCASKNLFAPLKMHTSNPKQSERASDLRDDYVFLRAHPVFSLSSLSLAAILSLLVGGRNECFYFGFHSRAVKCWTRCLMRVFEFITPYRAVRGSRYVARRKKTSCVILFCGYTFCVQLCTLWLAMVWYACYISLRISRPLILQAPFKMVITDWSCII